MIQATVSLNNGYLNRLTVKGHGFTGDPGSDLLCAAVSSLVRGVAQGIESIPEVDVDGKAEKEGNLDLVVQTVPEEYLGEVLGITRVLLIGLRGIQRDYPDNLEVTVNKITE